MDVFVGTDFSENSRPAVEWAAYLADQMGGKLVVTHVVDLASGDNAWRVLVETPEEIEQAALEEARESLESFFEETVVDRPEHLEYRAVLGNPVDELTRLAEEGPEDSVIVAGTRGASRLQEVFLGSSARRLVRRSQRPVILVPPEAEVRRPERLLVGVDFSEPSREAIRRAAMMARTYGATGRAVYGYVLPEMSTVEGAMLSSTENYQELVEQKRQRLEQIVAEEGADDVIDDVIAVQSSPEQALVRTAEDEDAQFIFVGTHGREGVKRFFLGNTAERVMRRSDIPVFVAPAVEREGEDEEEK